MLLFVPGDIYSRSILFALVYPGERELAVGVAAGDVGLVASSLAVAFRSFEITRSTVIVELIYSLGHILNRYLRNDNQTWISNTDPAIFLRRFQLLRKSSRVIEAHRYRRQYSL